MQGFLNTGATVFFVFFNTKATALQQQQVFTCLALPLTQLPGAILQVCIPVQVSMPLWASSPACSSHGEVSSPGPLRLAARSPHLTLPPHTTLRVVWLTTGFEPRSLAQNPNSILPTFPPVSSLTHLYRASALCWVLRLVWGTSGGHSP